ncbi:MAG: bifunctional enoyl-CoA hydratase/phosphate acetyltransferase [Spirochaetaceae bacterium]
MALLSFEALRAQVSAGKRVTVAVAAAADGELLEAVAEAAQAGFCRGVLFGPRPEVEELLAPLSVPRNSVEIVDVSDPETAAREAVRAVSRGEAEILMKGLVDTSVLLSAVLDAEAGLRTDRVLSHVALFEIEGFPRLLALTDAAMNIDPDLERKEAILRNGVELLRGLGLEEPKVAVLCAKEKVSEKMPCTGEAAELARRNATGEIDGCVVAGPYALDNAVSPSAAAHKGIEGPVAGMADLLLVPDIEAGNILYKALAFLAGARVAGVIAGASAPIVLTSRADSAETKANSLALAARFAQGQPISDP